MSSKVTREFMQEVQDRGWHIVSASEKSVIGGCPMEGCGMRAEFVPGIRVPNGCVQGPSMKHVEVNSYRDLHEFMRERRPQLGISLIDANTSAGLTHGHWHKFEQEIPQRIPNLDTLVTMLATVGYKLIAVPDKLRRVVLANMADTRAGQDRLQQINDSARKRREG